MPDEAEYRLLVKTVSNRFGPAAATFFQQLYRLAYTKVPCDICLSDGAVFTDVTIGADFVYALEFEAPVETVLGMLLRIKIITDDVSPVVEASMDKINAVIFMPTKKITKAEINAKSAKPRLIERDCKGQTLEVFIRTAYKPKSEDELNFYAARYLLALERNKNHEP